VMMAPPGGIRPLGTPLPLAPPITTSPVVIAPPKPRVEKPIALYIGHLTSLVKDDFFKTLLAYCGHMKSWKRVTSSFGFVEYYSPDSALRCMRVLGGRMLLGKSVLVNADKKTKELLDQYTKDVKQGKVRPLTHPGDDAIGKTGEQILTDQDAVATNLIQTLIASETEKKGLKQDDAKEEKSHSEPRTTIKSKSPETEKVLPSISTSMSRIKSRSRKRSPSPSRSETRSHSRSKSRRNRSKHKRPRSLSRRSRSRSRRRHRRRRKKRKKERRKRSKRRSESAHSPKREKKETQKEEKKTFVPDPNNLPVPGSATAPTNAKELVSYIPKDQEKLFDYPIDWKLVEKNDLVEKVMRVWIDARIQEYLGEQEADLTNFAVGLLAHHIPPKDIKSEMEMVLVEDAEPFVVKMWRRIIFESLKVKYTIS